MGYVQCSSCATSKPTQATCARIASHRGTRRANAPVNNSSQPASRATSSASTIGAALGNAVSAAKAAAPAHSADSADADAQPVPKGSARRPTNKKTLSATNASAAVPYASVAKFMVGTAVAASSCAMLRSPRRNVTRLTPSAPAHVGVSYTRAAGIHACGPRLDCFLYISMCYISWHVVCLYSGVRTIFASRAGMRSL